MAAAIAPKRARARSPKPRTDVAPPTPAAVGRALGGRLSVDTANALFGAFPRIIAPPVDHETGWRVLRLDEQTLERLSPAQLMAYLVDLSPDLSRAHHDFLRLCNPGIETFAAYRPGTTEAYPEAQAAIDGFRARLDELYGSFDIPINRLFTAIYLRGAFCIELVLDAAGRAPVDLATPDPASIYFISAEDPERGVVWVPGQWQRGGFVPLDRPTFRYLPVDPLPGSPYGRAHAWAALFPTLMRIGMLHDIRRVIAQQGYPYVDIAVAIETVRATLAYDDRDNPQALLEALNAQIAQIQEVYAQRGPDDAYAHTDAATVKVEKGAISTDVVAGAVSLMELLSHEDVRALKTMPILQGMSDNVSEGNSNRQWEILAATIKAAQHPVETELAAKLKLGLRAQGIQADVVLRFAEIRSAELLRDQQTRRLELTNLFYEFATGLTSMEQYAFKATKGKPDQQAPRAWPGVGFPSNADPGTVVPEPGANRNLADATILERVALGQVRFTPDEEAHLLDLLLRQRDREAAEYARARVVANGNGHREEQP